MRTKNSVATRQNKVPSSICCMKMLCSSGSVVNKFLKSETNIIENSFCAAAAANNNNNNNNNPFRGRPQHHSLFCVVCPSKSAFFSVVCLSKSARRMRFSCGYYYYYCCVEVGSSGVAFFCFSLFAGVGLPLIFLLLSAVVAAYDDMMMGSSSLFKKVSR